MWARPDLRAELKGLGLLRSPDLDHAFLHVRQESFLPESLSLLAYADMPLPVHISTNPPSMPRRGDRPPRAGGGPASPDRGVPRWLPGRAPRRNRRTGTCRGRGDRLGATDPKRWAPRGRG